MKVSALAILCLSTVAHAKRTRSLKKDKKVKKDKKPKKTKPTVLTPSADYQDHYLVSE